MASRPRVPTATELAPERSNGSDAGWRAAAFCRLGLAWQGVEDYERAQAYYTQALRARPHHEPALHNLAVTQIRLDRYAAAAYHLTDLIGLLDESPWPELRYSAEYNLALAQRYDGQLDSAVTTAVGLLERIRVRLDQLAEPTAALHAEEAPAEPDEHPAGAGAQEPSATDVQQAYLDRLAPQATLMVAGTLAAWWEQRGTPMTLVPDAMDPDAERDPAAEWSVPATELWREEKDLPVALELYVRTLGTRLSRRTRYNLACFRSARAQARRRLEKQSPLLAPEDVSRYLEPAWLDLELALETGRLSVWAQHDPALDYMRTIGRFWTILGVARPADAPPPADVASAASSS
jgi:tetratricopeptide (TPR) repeat protein